MIQKINFGKHENVTLIKFGTGDILITKAKDEDGKPLNKVIFSQDVDKAIGTETDEYSGKDTDTLENISVIMEFTNPASITTLIHSLVEVQKELFQTTNSD